MLNLVEISTPGSRHHVSIHICFPKLRNNFVDPRYNFDNFPECGSYTIFNTLTSIIYEFTSALYDAGQKPAVIRLCPGSSSYKLIIWSNLVPHAPQIMTRCYIYILSRLQLVAKEQSINLRKHLLKCLFNP